MVGDYVLGLWLGLGFSCLRETCNEVTSPNP